MLQVEFKEVALREELAILRERVAQLEAQAPDPKRERLVTECSAAALHTSSSTPRSPTTAVCVKIAVVAVVVVVVVVAVVAVVMAVVAVAACAACTSHVVQSAHCQRVTSLPR